MAGSRLAAWLLALAALAALSPAGPALAQQPEALVIIKSSGEVEVVMEVDVEPGLNEVALPVEPIPATILVEIDGSLVPPLYSEGKLYIPSEVRARALITYSANVKLEDGAASFQVVPQREVVLVVEPGVVILSLPQGITGYDVGDDGSLSITFTQPSNIRYTLSEAVTAPPTQETPPAATETPRDDQEQETQPREDTEAAATGPEGAVEAGDGRDGLGGLAIAAIAAVLALAGGVAVLALKRRGGGGGGRPLEASFLEPGELDATDIQILRTLADMGGEALQAELQRRLDMPKSTLWRRLRRLKEMGYIDIMREGKTNRVKLLKEPPSGS